MTTMSTLEISETVKSVCGENIELSRCVEQMLIDAYAKGRNDAFDMLGLDADEFADTQEPVAWTV